MTATVGVCERFYRLLAVRFSLFRHPPRGGSADATFPRWGKERAAADSPDVAVCFWCCCRGVGTPPPTLRCCGFVEAWVSSKAPSPIPSPCRGRRPRRPGGCRPQGRQERENMTEPRCGNDRSRGDMRMISPLASGQILPLPSSASWGIGGCHLPPLGEGNGSCEFAETLSCGKVLLRNAGDGVPCSSRQKPRTTSGESAAPRRARRPRRAAQQYPRFLQLRANSQAPPRREGACVKTHMVYRLCKHMVYTWGSQIPAK